MSRLTGQRVLVVGMLLTVMPSVLAGGNIQTGAYPPHGLNNLYWDARQQPATWTLEPSPEHGFPADYVLPILEAALDTWRAVEHVEFPQFTYGGIFDGVWAEPDGASTVLFADLDVISGISGAIASAPCEVLNLPRDVVDGSDGFPGNGLGRLYWRGDAFDDHYIVPIGHYEPGVIFSCDMIFNHLENTFSDDSTPGTEDLLGVATHEFGHWAGVSHTPMPDATMVPVITTNPPADGSDGQASLEPDDIAALGHIYKTESFDEHYGTISGRVRMASQGGDGVHVVAMRASDLEPVAGRFSISWLTNATDRFEGANWSTYGTGYYRLDGAPPGAYYVYAEWYDATDEPLGRRLHSLATFGVAFSNVASGYYPYRGELGILAQRFEFYNSRESGDGGDGVTPGLTVDNPDEATVVQVLAGENTHNVNIDINLVPNRLRGPQDRGDPSGIGRHDLTPLVNLRGGAVLSFEGEGDDDYWLLRFPAEELPEPPYNVLEGIWFKWGRADRPYTGGMLMSAPGDPESLEPAIVWDSRRLVTGWDGGNTGISELFPIRDRFNVTINRPRDLYFMIKQPETLPDSTFFSQSYFAMVAVNGTGNATGRTLFTRDGFDTFEQTASTDVVYRVRTEQAPAVMLLSADPPTLTRGDQNVLVTIRGAGFRPDFRPAVFAPTFGPPATSGVTVKFPQFSDATTFRFLVDVAPDAPLGPLDVQLAADTTVIPNRARLLEIVPVDTDQDGVGDPFDCAPDDATLWSVPGDVDGSLFVDRGVVGEVLVMWEPPANPGAATWRYDVLRGDLAELRESGNVALAECFAGDLTAPFVTDTDPVAPGMASYYLVRATNACGAGSFGNHGDPPPPC